MQRKRSRDVWLRNKGSKNGVFILIVHWSDGLENKWALIASEEFCESNAYRLPPLWGGRLDTMHAGLPYTFISFSVLQGN